MARSQFGACRHGYEFLFLRFDLGLNNKLCDVGWLKLFGFEENGWVVMSGAMGNGDCGFHYSCHCGYGILF